MPKTTNLLLNHLCGGPNQRVNLANFDIFTKPLTQFVVKNSNVTFPELTNS